MLFWLSETSQIWGFWVISGQRVGVNVEGEAYFRRFVSSSVLFLISAVLDHNSSLNLPMAMKRLRGGDLLCFKAIHHISRSQRQLGQSQLSYTSDLTYFTFDHCEIHAIWTVTDVIQHNNDKIFIQDQSLSSWFNIKMSFYQYRKSHCGDKMIIQPSCLHYGISYTGWKASLCWIRDQTFK